MLRHVPIAISAVTLPLLAEVDPSGGWITSIGGLTLAMILCIKVIPDIVAKQSAALDRVTNALDLLRVHCAGKIGEPPLYRISTPAAP